MNRIFTLVLVCCFFSLSLKARSFFNSDDVLVNGMIESVKSKNIGTKTPGYAASRMVFLYGRPTASITGGILKDLKIILGPNPVIDILTLDFKNQEGGAFDLQITDERGSIILNDKINVSSGAKHDINLSGFPKGTYILTLRNQAGVWSEKIVKIQ